MALLFHGTIGESTVRSIFREGLRPAGSGDSSASHWAHRLTGSPRDRLVFMSTSPVSGKGGDPVAFALGWPIRAAANPSGDPGYIVVLDLPPDALGAVRAVVPNGELDAYIELSWLKDAMSRRDAFEVVLKMVRSLFERRVPLDSASVGRELELRVKLAASDLGVEGELTAGRWAAFVVEYGHLVDVRWGDFSSDASFHRERRKLVRRHGFRLPDHIEDDSHSRVCSLCAGGLVGLAMGLRGDPLEVDVSMVSPVGRKLALEGGLADLLRVVGGQFDPPTPGAVDAYCRDRGGRLSLGELLDSPPGDTTKLPPLWRPGYGRRISTKDFLLPDHQVLADAVEARHVLGAIELTDGRRLLPRFSRGRGRSGTLASQLWSLVHELRDGKSGASGGGSAGARRPRIV